MTNVRRQVLVVDDIPEILDFFRSVVRRLQVQAEPAPEGEPLPTLDVELTTETDGQRALDLLKTRRFDLVISDFRMRGVDGVDVLTAARDAWPECIRILMTGYNEIPTPLDRIRKAGVDGYLQKPLKSKELLLLMLDLLHQNEETLDNVRRYAREMEGLAEREEAKNH